MMRWNPRTVLLVTIAVAGVLLAVAVLILSDPLVLKGYAGEPDFQVCPPTLIALTSGVALDFNDRACGDYAGVMLARAAWPFLGAAAATTAGAVVLRRSWEASRRAASI